MYSKFVLIVMASLVMGRSTLAAPDEKDSLLSVEPGTTITAQKEITLPHYAWNLGDGASTVLFAKGKRLPTIGDDPNVPSGTVICGFRRDEAPANDQKFTRGQVLELQDSPQCTPSYMKPYGNHGYVKAAGGYCVSKLKGLQTQLLCTKLIRKEGELGLGVLLSDEGITVGDVKEALGISNDEDANFSIAYPPPGPVTRD